MIPVRAFVILGLGECAFQNCSAKWRALGTLSSPFHAMSCSAPGLIGVASTNPASVLVSRIPTYAMKGFRVPLRWVLPVMLLVGLFAASLVSAPWMTMSAAILIYIAAIPFAIRTYGSLKQKAEALQGGSPGSDLGAADEPPSEDEIDAPPG